VCVCVCVCVMGNADTPLQWGTPVVAPEPEPAANGDGDFRDGDSWFGLLSDQILIQQILLPVVIGEGFTLYSSTRDFVPMDKTVVAKALCQLARVSSLWRDITASELLWQPLFAVQYGRGGGDPPAQPLAPPEHAALDAGCPWKRLYAEAHLQAYLRGRSPHGDSVTIWGSEVQVSTAIKAAIAGCGREMGEKMGSIMDKASRAMHDASKKLRGCTKKQMLFVGLDAVGRTTALYKLQLGEVVTVIPTIGFNVETIEYQNTDFIIWDAGGGDRIRPLYRHYFAGLHVLCWFIDSNDRERMNESMFWLWSLLRE
jgi:hypothetical protein